MCLFIDALNTFFYLRLYGIEYFKDHRDNERKSAAAIHGLLFLINCKGSHKQDSIYHSLCYTGWNEK